MGQGERPLWQDWVIGGLVHLLFRRGKWVVEFAEFTPTGLGLFRSLRVARPIWVVGATTRVDARQAVAETVADLESGRRAVPPDNR